MDLINNRFNCSTQMPHSGPHVKVLSGVMSRGYACILVYGPYIEIHEETYVEVELSYLTLNKRAFKAGVFDINLSKVKENGEVEFIEVAKRDLSTTGKKIKKVSLSFDTSQYIGFKVEFRVFVEEGIELNAFTIQTKEVGSSHSNNEAFVAPQKLYSQNRLQKKKLFYTLLGLVVVLCKNPYLLKRMPQVSWERFKYSKIKNETQSFKNILLRKICRFLGIYPSLKGVHFYYERANSFMAPKTYEYAQMFKGITLKKSDKVLDLGCGDGWLPLVIGKKVNKVVGVDISESISDAQFKAAELSGKVNAEFYSTLLEEANFQDEVFDKVTSFSVIEHIPNYMEVFEELFRVLKQDGELIISVDSFSHFNQKQREVHRRNFEVQKYFQKDELYTMLKNLGFKEVTVTPIFKSKFSEKWFSRVMNNPGEYFGAFKRFYSFFLYFKIAYHEKKVQQDDHGIFLIAKCKK